MTKWKKGGKKPLSESPRLGVNHLLVQVQAFSTPILRTHRSPEIKPFSKFNKPIDWACGSVLYQTHHEYTIR